MTDAFIAYVDDHGTEPASNDFEAPQKAQCHRPKAKVLDFKEAGKWQDGGREGES
jgi:hypothetical protein